ncbi:MAG: hypothetical protein EOQ41_17470 [Mesorhizobium sp.]|nr:MAG: hypothetical protein EOQ41_17470 [Mesorhizobium sp.]RWD40280.1 MAG: hypothetical protein EOS35_32180 [Mesorhizobium sp.]
MTVHKKDYRTNRADYAIAAKHGGATAKGDELPARTKKSLLVRDRRSAKLAANPWKSALDPNPKTRG